MPKSSLDLLANKNELKNQLAEQIYQVPGVKAILSPPGLSALFTSDDPHPIEIKSQVSSTGDDSLRIELYLEVGLERAAGEVGNAAHRQIVEYLKTCSNPILSPSIQIQILRISE